MQNLQLLLGAGLVWVGVFVAASLAAAALYRAFRLLTAYAPPRPRNRAIAIYGFLPVLIASLVVCLLNFAVLYSWVLPEHCHDAVCAPHAPEFAAPAAEAAVMFAAALIGVAVALWFVMAQLRRRLRQSRFSRHLARPGRGYQVIESDIEAAWCDGLWRPTVFVSRGLVNKLDRADLEIVVAHEKAHARRRDNLVRLVLHWASRLWPTTPREALLSDFMVSAEQACDAEAASLVGDPQHVRTVIATLGSAVPDNRTQSIRGRLSELASAGTYREGSMLAPWAALVTLWLGAAFVFTLAAHPLLEKLSI